ncbi:LPXTG cell wall anchor domain-containing protein [Streptomyces sp. ET3-23]|uniref:LAETG motif-containing sortase-dependent surface protein n=1 Tax=Streptomyces sp. ET3-23 TaxID=2885643 RepID=UPI001D10714C|nr:LAETG motif-containing sortase-dependent surface protein [Streptomyces sp. ET3-23]MCC2279121.1 LPXTG cell wall anchor domain-containing protein [Streptomyces sp. ET3-23]
MKLSRIATVAAAVSLAPAVFLATPALADDGNPGQSQAGTATEPKKETTDATTQTDQEAKATLTSPDFPKKLVAGAKDWTDFSLDIDNTKGEAVDNFELRFALKTIFDGKDHPGTNKSELEYQGADTKWRSVFDPSAYGSVFGTVKDGKLEKGGRRTINLRIRLDAGFPTNTSAHVSVDASGVVKPAFPHIPVETQAPAASPKPPTHGGDKDHKASESPSPAGSPSASPKPSPTASASATASASPSPAAGTGTGTGTGTGDSNTTANGGDTTQLASTGAGSETPWLIAGSAAALVAGTGMVVAARRRSASRG